jgi:hypothetical protein
MQLNRIILLLFMATWISCGADVPNHEEFVVGMSRTDISSRFGEPDRTQVFTKSGNGIRGPIEDF